MSGEGAAPGPGADLRLVPAALAAVAAAWLVTAGPSAPWSGPPAVAGAALLLVVGAVGAVLLGARSSRGGRARGAAGHLVLVPVCVLAVCAGAWIQSARQAPVLELATDGALVRLAGQVASQPRPATFGDGHRWALAVGSVDGRGASSAAAGLVEVTSPGPAPRYGATVEISGVLRAVPAGDGVVARVASAETVRERAAPGAVLRATHTLRSALADVSGTLSPQARALVPGVAVGDTSRMPDDLDTAMRTTSLTHVTAVSGGHFAIVVATLTALCAVLRAPRAVRIGVLVVAALGFVALVRPEPSVLRAAWTCALGLLGLALGRPSAGLPALAAAATGLLVVDPWLARSYGFALSCAATAGLVLLSGPLARRLAPWTGRPLAFALAVPWAAQAACGPVLVLLDPRVSLVAVPANLLAAPALVPATVLGLVATLLAPWAPGAAHVVAWTAGLATSWIAALARWFAALPGATVPWPGGVGGALALAALTAVALALVLRRPPGDGWARTWRGTGPGLRWPALRGRPGPVVVGGVAGAGAVVVVLVAWTTGLPGPPGMGGGGVPPDWRVVACDVGQGDALVVRSGPEAAVVVDVGPPGGGAGACLDRLGVATVDLLVLSHFHADHVGGLGPVLAGRHVAGALVSPLDAPADGAGAVRARLAETGVPVRAASAGDRGTAGSVGWEVLAADPSGGGRAGAASDEGDGANEASVAVRLRTAGGLDLVALGDLETGGQEALLRSLAGTATAADVDVVKMSHHGSRAQSAALARWLSPRVTLVSVGEGNTYGHPTDAALDLYAGVGSAVVRTDECGTAALVLRDSEIGLSCARAGP
ncbi:ComEC/Rec2 family competence protein [Isoptericola sp. BMS4]|uniref:ComEC/Rec2 family competence protein n=1 Tax=Isoptericola sp. BMS4 TaxID=2527875 RepID=UPI00141E9BD1|nr:ComEC/Rec2 family competence protein [Isoptericola sp. BMS4]